MSKLLTVFGATGHQGGSVIHAVQADPQLSATYTIRGVTRDVSKPAAQALTQKGVEVVQGDINDPAALRRILDGSSAVFAVTNYWEQGKKEVEVSQGKNIADISREVGVEHLIWSSLPNVTKMTGGTLAHVDHFDSKAEVEEYIRAQQIPASFVQPGFYMQNLKGMIRLGDDGASYTWTNVFHPTTKVPMIDIVADSGRFVVAALRRGPRPDAPRILSVSQWVAPTDVQAVLEELTGKTFTYVQVDEATFMTFLPPTVPAKELTENMVLVRDYAYYGPGAEEESRTSMDLVSHLTTFKEWAATAGF